MTSPIDGLGGHPGQLGLLTMCTDPDCPGVPTIGVLAGVGGAFVVTHDVACPVYTALAADERTAYISADGVTVIHCVPVEG